MLLPPRDTFFLESNYGDSVQFTGDSSGRREEKRSLSTGDLPPRNSVQWAVQVALDKWNRKLSRWTLKVLPVSSPPPPLLHLVIIGDNYRDHGATSIDGSETDGPLKRIKC